MSDAPLPAGLADPLHILEPGSGLPWEALAALAGLLLLWWWSRRRRGREPAPAPGTAPAAGDEPAGIVDAIRAVRARFLESARHRQGCHALAALLRAHFQGLAKGEPPLSALTAWEIRRLLGDRPASRLLTTLAELQFGRREVRRGDLQAACDLAVEVVGGEQPSRPGKGRRGGRR